MEQNYRGVLPMDSKFFDINEATTNVTKDVDISDIRTRLKIVQEFNIRNNRILVEIHRFLLEVISRLDIKEKENDK